MWRRRPVAQGAVDSIVNDAMIFISKLAYTLRQGLPQEKLVALRQCIERVWINRPNGHIKIRFHVVPIAQLTRRVDHQIQLVTWNTGVAPAADAMEQSPPSG